MEEEFEGLQGNVGISSVVFRGYVLEWFEWQLFLGIQRVFDRWSLIFKKEVEIWSCVC